MSVRSRHIPKNSEAREIAKRAIGRVTGGRYNENDFSGPDRHVWRQRDAKFPIGRNVRVDVDGLDHAPLPEVAEDCTAIASKYVLPCGPGAPDPAGARGG